MCLELVLLIRFWFRGYRSREWTTMWPSCEYMFIWFWNCLCHYNIYQLKVCPWLILLVPLLECHSFSLLFFLSIHIWMLQVMQNKTCLLILHMGTWLCPKNLTIPILLMLMLMAICICGCRAIQNSICYHNKGCESETTREFADAYYMLLFGVIQIVLSQIPNLHNINWLSVVAAIMSFTYCFIGLGLSILQILGIHHYLIIWAFL